MELLLCDTLNTLQGPSQHPELSSSIAPRGLPAHPAPGPWVAEEEQSKGEFFPWKIMHTRSPFDYLNLPIHS